MKIRTYLLLMALAILGPVIVFSAIALGMLQESGRTAALRGLHETARATALTVDRELIGAEAALRIQASSYYLEVGDMARFYARANTANRQAGTWTVLCDELGRQLVNTSVPFGTALPRLAPDAVRRALAAQKPTVGNLFAGTQSGRPVTTLNFPVVLPDGRRYVLAEVFIASYFEDLIAQRQVPPSWVIGIIDDQTGLFVARSHRAGELVGKPARAELVAAARAAPQGQLRHNTLEGMEAYDAFTHSTISGWTVAVAAPVAVIEASARSAIMVASLGLLAALVCAAVAGGFFGRRLIDSIHRAARAANALGHGQTPVAEHSAVDEVQALHSALHDAGKLLIHERQSRQQAESERLRLLVSEREARRSAEQQNRAKDQFLAMLGHEIRNPLSAISGAAALIGLEAHDNARLNRARDILARQSSNLTHIVDDLLDVTRVTTGKILLHAEAIDLASVVASCLEGLRASGRCEQRVLRLHSTPAWVHADRTRLEQIVNNLLGNACKYTPVGGCIEVAVQPSGDSAELTVRDDGVGISAELLPHVFDLFVQGAEANSLERSQGGLGIGLTLVRQLVMLHGGTVAAASDGCGKGSRFSVRLPLLPVLAPPDAPALQPAGGACRVLLVEDNADGREMLAMGLGLYGHQVFEADNGIDGVALALAERPDVAIVDIGLPGMNGYDVAGALRANIDTRHMRLIALTGYGQDSDRERALAAGFDVHVVKPADMTMLLRLIYPADEMA